MEPDELVGNINELNPGKDRCTKRGKKRHEKKKTWILNQEPHRSLVAVFFHYTAVLIGNLSVSPWQIDEFWDRLCSSWYWQLIVQRWQQSRRHNLPRLIEPTLAARRPKDMKRNVFSARLLTMKWARSFFTVWEYCHNEIIQCQAS